MRLIATILFIIELLFTPGTAKHVYVPDHLDSGRMYMPSGIPYPYYKMGCVIPLGMKTETWLTELEWPYELEEDVWDCSQTAAYTEWVMENCGYKTEIILLPHHALVQIKFDGVWRVYETTSREWTLIDYPPTTTFSTIFSLYIWMWNEADFTREFAWWLK